MREKTVERHLVLMCRDSGLLCLKFTSPARNGVPDRVIVGAGRTVFVEVKRPGERPTRLQLATHAKMRRFGAEVFVVSSRAAVDELVEQLTGRRAAA